MRPRQSARKSNAVAPAHEQADAEHSWRDTQRVEALDRGLALLKTFRRGDGPLGNAELAQRTGLSKPTVSRLAYTLVESGFLVYDPVRRQYVLGPSAVALGCTALANVEVREIAREPLRELADRAAFNVGLGTRDRLHMMFVEALEGQALIGLRLFTGMRIPLAVSAMGRAYLAGLADREREDVMAELEVEAGKRWRTVKRGIVQAIEEVKGRGFCLSIGDWRPEINGAAAAVRLEDGRVFAIDLGGPAYLLSEARLIETLGAQVAMTARMIESAVSTKRPGDVSGGRSLGKRTN